MRLAGYVLDTSAIMAVLQGEPGAEQVQALIGDRDVALPFVSLMEVEYKLLRRLPALAGEAMRDVLAWPVEVVESDARWRREAARVKARGGLSFADAWVASLALLRDAELVHKDPEFESVPDLKMLRLPYDREARP